MALPADPSAVLWPCLAAPCLCLQVEGNRADTQCRCWCGCQDGLGAGSFHSAGVRQSLGTEAQPGPSHSASHTGLHRGGGAQPCLQRGSTRCRAPVTWIWREGWHPAPPPRSSRAEPSAGAGLNPLRPGSPRAMGLPAPGDKRPARAMLAAPSLPTHQGLLHPPDGAARSSACWGCKFLPSAAADQQRPPCGLGRAWAEPHSPRRCLRMSPAPRSPGAVRAQPHGTAPAPQPSAAPPCCRVAAAAAPSHPSGAEGRAARRALRVHPRQGAPGSCAGFGSSVLRLAPVCLELHPHPGPEQGQPLPGWYEPASGRVCEGSVEQASCGLEGGRTVHPPQRVP